MGYTAMIAAEAGTPASKQGAEGVVAVTRPLEGIQISRIDLAHFREQ